MTVANVICIEKEIEYIDSQLGICRTKIKGADYWVRFNTKFIKNNHLAIENKEYVQWKFELITYRSIVKEYAEKIELYEHRRELLCRELEIES